MMEDIIPGETSEGFSGELFLCFYLFIYLFISLFNIERCIKG
jgi:hypothetical protein